MTYRLVGIVGNNADFSYNRLLLQYIQSAFGSKINLGIQEIRDIPLFNENSLKTPPVVVTQLAHAIDDAEGVIISVPEYDHAIPSCLKSVLEWLSSSYHPFNDKPVMIVGASYGIQGTVRAQMNLRQVLDSPGVNARILPGNEFMLSNVNAKFVKDDLIDAKSVTFLECCLDNF